MAIKAKPLDVKKMLASNPKVDAKKLLETLEVMVELQKVGIINTSGYSLAMPFSKRVSSSSANDEIEPDPLPRPRR